ncbi:hypothetical protein WDU94_010149 [Cyamophila willieti]
MADLGSIGVESRFAVLNKKKKKPKKEESNVNGLKTKTAQPQTQNQPKKKPQTQPPLVGLPGNHIPEDPEEKKKRKKKKKLPNQTAQWDEWRQKDEEVVDKEFDKSIQKALTLSKLEQKRRLLVPAVISTSDTTPTNGHPPSQTQQSNGKTNNKPTDNSPKLLDDLIESQISHEKFKSLLGVKDEEISQLRHTVDELTAEMKQIKLRNKSLCTIISEGEIKSKAELILELESSIKMKDELLTEVNRLNTQLEQERSKVHVLSSGIDKTHKTKKHKKSESEK